MTKSWERSHNEIVDEAKQEAARTGRDINDILTGMLKAAKAARDKARTIKIQRAQKFLKLRNKQKRRRKR
jgi:hypothetical protein